MSSNAKDNSNMSSSLEESIIKTIKQYIDEKEKIDVIIKVINFRLKNEEKSEVIDALSKEKDKKIARRKELIESIYKLDEYLKNNHLSENLYEDSFQPETITESTESELEELCYEDESIAENKNETLKEKDTPSQKSQKLERIIEYNLFLFAGIISLYAISSIIGVRKGSTDNSIKNAIYSSHNLNEEEKDFLWNEQLIKDLKPYYKNTKYDFLTRAKHNEIDIIPYTESDLTNEFLKNTDGYYRYGTNVIHVRDYDSDSLDESRITQNVVGHEYIHLLEASQSYEFLKESVATIMAQEYFLNSGNSADTISYTEACRYTRVLMEIIGPEPIIESVFIGDFTKLKKEITTYLSYSEANEFLNIIKLRPENSELNYSRLQELLTILYQNKFNENIESNPMIMTIFENREYNRIYFNSSLKLTNPSYYVDYEGQTWIFDGGYSQNLQEDNNQMKMK